MRTVTEFNISANEHRGVQLFLRKHGKSADGVFHLAILVLPKTRQTLIVFHQCPPRLPAGKSKTTSI